ncbi:MAG: hypothetical protein NC187_02540 [Candidatus Amulumruptor caecigallinarius]|nr:hypothetical protein [Candidatus Amulumruptor caecigallinarius]MCM1396355.1 hypothetical protein [Candidatus Amulumruptor caecigallinarius]MCM1453703.1 hypothetical protein [bacterium]
MLSLSIAGTSHAIAPEAAPDDTAATRRYAFDISVGSGHLSGIMLARDLGTEIAGTLVNEFGITALSFIRPADTGKMELRDPAPFLDKWYIRRVLRNDLSHCLDILYSTPCRGKHSNLSTHISADTVTVTNPSHHITYSFHPLDADASPLQ